jgi:putative heme-binding domain-containing protein
VRSQLASTAKRLPATDGLPIVRGILLRNEDLHDAHIPLLLWWAVEHHALGGIDYLLNLCTDAVAWKTPMIREVILPRLMRRYAAEGTDATYAACSRLLAAARTEADRTLMLVALDQGLQDQVQPASEGTAGDLFRSLAMIEQHPNHLRIRNQVSPELDKQLKHMWSDQSTDVALIRLMARLGSKAAHQRAVALATRADGDASLREKLLRLLGEIDAAAFAPKIMSLVGGTEPLAIQQAALDALDHFESHEITADLLKIYPQAAGLPRVRMCEMLLSRKHSALVFLRGVDAGKYSANEVAIEQLRLISLHQDKELNDLVRKHWGNIAGGSPEEKLAEMRRLNNDLRAGPGNPLAGKLLFVKHCASCHRLFGEGNLVGPELTHANRKDRDYLLASIVDPSAVIRKEYLSYIVQTRDGRLLTGLIAEQSANSLTLLDAKNQRTTIARTAIEAVQESAVSLMPENLLKELKPNEVRDLFSYLQSDGPPVDKEMKRRSVH